MWACDRVQYVDIVQFETKKVKISDALPLEATHPTNCPWL